MSGAGDHLALEADVSSMKAVKEAAEKVQTVLRFCLAWPSRMLFCLQVQSHFGSVADVVVNSAGITRDTYMLKMSEEAFDKVIQVNLKVSKKGQHSKVTVVNAVLV